MYDEIFLIKITTYRQLLNDKPTVDNENIDIVICVGVKGVNEYFKNKNLTMIDNLTAKSKNWNNNGGMEQFWTIYKAIKPYRIYKEN